MDACSESHLGLSGLVDRVISGLVDRGREASISTGAVPPTCRVAHQCKYRAISVFLKAYQWNLISLWNTVCMENFSLISYWVMHACWINLEKKMKNFHLSIEILHEILFWVVYWSYQLTKAFISIRMYIHIQYLMPIHTIICSTIAPYVYS